MKNKNKLLLTAVLGAGLLVVGSHWYQKRFENKKQAALQEIRLQFASFGEIATIYIDETASTKGHLEGGVVMEDGVVFAFVYESGQIDYWEESK